ncbi:MAG: hypothetical protein ACI9DC_005153, partial [Gammaproteobacteria bacterium]
ARWSSVSFDHSDQFSFDAWMFCALAAKQMYFEDGLYEWDVTNLKRRNDDNVTIIVGRKN